MQFKQQTLPNGLTIIAEVNPAAASMALGFFVRTGSRDESSALPISGVSHFLEHMMFKGTDRRSPFDINREFDEMGAAYNAFTSEENTVYFGAVLPEFQNRVLDLLADMMRPALRDEDFQTEKKVILEEIALYQDRPQFRLFEKLMAEHFGDHPLSHSVLGTNESIQALKREDMLDYFNRRYSSGNVTLVSAGNLDWSALLAGASSACGGWKDYSVSRDTPESAGSRRNSAIVDARLVRQHIGVMSAAPSAQDDRRYAGQMLSMILGDVVGSRLFYALVEPAIAEEASCTYEPLDGTGIFMTFISADPARASEALQIARDEYDKFMSEGPTDREMSAAANKIASTATLRGELPMGRLTALGFDWVYRRRYRPLAEHIERIFAVTSGQVHELARDFDLNATTVLTLGPDGSVKA
ncbi:MAG: pitrilysin family protein [Planctomycetota bacterium]|nr:pitrilysin family protein [Planctomycetota bacterium]